MHAVKVRAKSCGHQYSTNIRCCVVMKKKQKNIFFGKDIKCLEQCHPHCLVVASMSATSAADIRGGMLVDNTQDD